MELEVLAVDLIWIPAKKKTLYDATLLMSALRRKKESAVLRFQSQT